ncbi:MAG: STAS domain-containing protein [Acidobacteria bacterium]|jgi:anti-sigma B factor antagonist|nr:STAS domain-containing protein [Acidobacteriota bacterium]
MSIQIDVRRQEQTAVINVVGDIDLYSSPQVRQTILDALNEKSDNRVLVNLTGVKYIDSSGVASLVEGLQLARRSRVRFALCGLNKAPRQVLELTRLINVFDIFESIEDALKA